ncbi:MAG: SDR family NAD(P)-dependent oxidoreductase [Planctomycetia bacterium]|nr:SDR family NAD(P)-dependent oxidoreductase [Planctomycetia bacterium]
MSKILVTGATGFIGQHLARALVERGDEVTCLKRKTSRVEALEKLGVRLVEGDVTDAESLRPAVAGADIVFHLAGLTTAFHLAGFLRVNEQGTRNLLEACAARPTPPVVIHVSSIAAAGPSQGGQPRKEEDTAAPVSSYGRSKRAGEIAARKFADRVPLTIVRPPIIFGPGDRAVLEIFKPISRFGIHLIPGYRRNYLSLLYVADLVSGLLLAADRGQRVRSDRIHAVPVGSDRIHAVAEGDKSENQGYYYLAHDESPSYADLGRWIGRALGRRRTICVPTLMPIVWFTAATSDLWGRMRGRPAVFNVDKAREAAAGSWTCSAERAKRELGWSCAAGLPARLKETADWYRRERWL